MKTVNLKFAINNVPEELYNELREKIKQSIKNTDNPARHLSPELNTDMSAEYQDMEGIGLRETGKFLSMMLSFYIACSARKKYRDSMKN